MLGKANPESTIVQFVDWNFCKDALEKKKKLMTVNQTELCFKPDAVLYIGENITPFNQGLAWQCRELKRIKLIHSYWIHSCKNQVHYELTWLSIDSEKDSTVLNPDSVFKGRDRSKWKRSDIKWIDCPVSVWSFRCGCVWFIEDIDSKRFKGWVRYIFASLCLKENTCETRKIIFYFTSKALFVFEIIKV